jgi:hypothetical protein
MGTYLEDYLESMYMLPSEVKRNFDLMRELDKVPSLCSAVPTASGSLLTTSDALTDLVPSHRRAPVVPQGIPHKRAPQGRRALQQCGAGRSRRGRAARAGRDRPGAREITRKAPTGRSETRRENRDRGAVVRYRRPPHSTARPGPRGLRGAAQAEWRVRGRQGRVQETQARAGRHGRCSELAQAG